MEEIKEEIKEVLNDLNIANKKGAFENREHLMMSYHDWKNNIKNPGDCSFFINDVTLPDLNEAFRLFVQQNPKFAK